MPSIPCIFSLGEHLVDQQAHRPGTVMECGMPVEQDTFASPSAGPTGHWFPDVITLWSACGWGWGTRLCSGAGEEPRGGKGGCLGAEFSGSWQEQRDWGGRVLGVIERARGAVRGRAAMGGTGQQPARSPQ